MKRADFIRALRALGACNDPIAWVEATKGTPKQIWNACVRGDWMLWLAWRANPAHRDVYRAMCACARTALRYVPQGEDRPRIAIETRERWCDGRATEDECRAAAYAANAANAANAYAAAAAYAAYAANAANAANAYAAAAAYAAYAAAYAAYAAYADADASAAAAAYAAYAARKRAFKRHAALVRKHVKWADVEAGLSKLLNEVSK